MKHMNSRQGKIIVGLVFLFIAAIIFLPAVLSPVTEGTAVETGKSGNMAIVYSAIALLSVLLLIGYVLLEKKRDHRFMALFACVAAANCGYFLQSVSDMLNGAMMANRLSYMGSAYSIMVMLFIIMDACQSEKRKWTVPVLLGISTTAFLLAASGDWLGLYYEAVTIETVNGVTRLVKDYCPLHTLYPVYLLS